MNEEKIRVIKDYEKLDEQIQEQLKLVYPNGFSQYLISFTNKEGKLVSALPFETDDRYYLVRMTLKEAKQIIDEDEDYDDDGNLKDESREEYEDKYSDLDYIADNIDDDDFDID
jgi:DNA-directed RNA polymerase subunit K/omega